MLYNILDRIVKLLYSVQLRLFCNRSNKQENNRFDNIMEIL